MTFPPGQNPTTEDGGGIIIIIRKLSQNPRLPLSDRNRLSNIATALDTGQGITEEDKQFILSCFGTLIA